MTYIELMALARDKGFQGRVQMAMSDVAKDKGPGQAGPNLAYQSAVVKGTASVFQMTVRVLLDTAVSAAGVAATDAEIKTAVEGAWDSHAKAGV